MYWWREASAMIIKIMIYKAKMNNEFKIAVIGSVLWVMV